MLGISALIDLLRDRTEKRRALTDLDNATTFSANNATVNIAVTPANGTRVALAASDSNTNGGRAVLNIGTFVYSLFIIANTSMGMMAVRDLRTPDGATVSLTSGAAPVTAWAFAETL